MQFVGIDIAWERHVAAVVNEQGAVLMQPTPFGEDIDGYQKLRRVLGAPDQTLTAMEATGLIQNELFIS